MDEEPTPWAADSIKYEIHQYFSAFVSECNHELSQKGQDACVRNPDLSPGLDCCAICAVTSKKLSTKQSQVIMKRLVSCTKCKKVQYCCEDHIRLDLSIHSKICHTLKLIQEADSIEISPERESLLIDMLMSKIRGLNQDPKDWGPAVSKYFSSVWRSKQPSKMVNAAEQRGASGVVERDQRPAKDTKTKSTNPDTSSASTSSTVPLQAVELAVATSLLSYPMTLLYCLGGVNVRLPGLESARAPKETIRGESSLPSASSSAAPSTSNPSTQKGLTPTLCQLINRFACTAAHPSSHPLVVCVLGASHSAELSHLHMWKILEGCCMGANLCLQFVGPEVLAELHGTEKKLSEKLVATFWKGEYGELVNILLGLNRHGRTKEGTRKDERCGEQVTGLPTCLRLWPDVYVGYNMGLTCQDYSWNSTLKALCSVWKEKMTSSQGIAPFKLPLIVTANTYMEAIMEQEVLCASKGTWRLAAPVMANPFLSLELMQSGTLGNDLYRKNAWLACYEHTMQAAEVKEKKHANKLTSIRNNSKRTKL
ncbi:hypothetical protein CEUSTIGMA_g3034.t1 [Chlamydomonas eustigma]|uniref:Mitochondrial splicing suppressor 51-like C-terminal domain-containing protein n=1 Tax=Chlamydomonas eustigma TaxID=1157962 RepID=A0A250WYL0_9CHLO|nr:hypothetical protein CEUSTIGMA_g3034.t1 [Chlamydomonas eustigma]|eukprot:GAX75590.1 hypothetical protein CEUSTIGMA_g3034.t1 [Chlamydomonas eustigma]